MNTRNSKGAGRNPKDTAFFPPKKGKDAIPGMNSQITLLLTNEFILTPKLNRFYARETFRIYRKKWRTGVYIAAFATLAAGLVALIGFRFLPVGIPLIVFGLYFLFMASFGYLYGATVAYRSYRDFYGDPIQMKVEFHGQYFRIVTGKGNSDFLYKQVTKYIPYSEYDIWIVAAEGIIQHGQLIDKRTFTPEELNTYYSIIERNGLEQRK